jgi:two-component sensor histidine kinase
VWQERDGPAVAEPTRRGFGSKLLMRSIEGELNGRVAMRYLPGGFSCQIDIPLPLAVAQPFVPPVQRAVAV